MLHLKAFLNFLSTCSLALCFSLCLSLSLSPSLSLLCMTSLLIPSLFCECVNFVWVWVCVLGHRKLFDYFCFHTPAHISLSLWLYVSLSLPPSLAVSLAPVSLCRPMWIDGHAGATPSRRRAVPLFPEFFVVVLHCSAALVYSIVRLIVSLSSLAFCGYAREKAERREGDESRGAEEEEEGSEHCVPRSPFSCLSICFLLFLPVSVG